MVICEKYPPASSKWLFDSPNGGHLAPEEVTNKNHQKGHSEEPGKGFLHLGTTFNYISSS